MLHIRITSVVEGERRRVVVGEDRMTSEKTRTESEVSEARVDGLIGPGSSSSWVGLYVRPFNIIL